MSSPLPDTQPGAGAGDPAAPADRPDAVRAFLDAYKSSIDWVNGNPAQAGVLIEKEGMGLSAKAAASAIPRMSLVYQPAAQARKSVARLGELYPTLRISNLRDVLGPYRRSEDIAKYIEGLRMAGLPE